MVDIDIKISDLNLDPIKEIEQKAKQAMRATVKDWRKEGNKIVKESVGSMYTVKKSEISKAQKGFNQTGEFQGSLPYTGGVVGVDKFTFSPKSDAGRRSDRTLANSGDFRSPSTGRPWGSAAQVRQPNPYSITVHVKDGGTFPAGANVFIYKGHVWKSTETKLARGAKGGFFRGANSGIKRLYGPSVPTMVLHANDERGMDSKLADMAQKALDKNVEQYLK